MVLDLLPFQRSPGRLPGRWGWLRCAHFALSLGLPDGHLYPGLYRSQPAVLSTECTLCQTCISACPTEALRLSVGFDMGGEENFRMKELVH
jgi:ferredoxin